MFFLRLKYLTPMFGTSIVFFSWYAEKRSCNQGSSPYSGGIYVVFISMVLWVPEGHDVVLSLTEALKRPTFAKAPEKKGGGFKGRQLESWWNGWKRMEQGRKETIQRKHCSIR